MERRVASKHVVWRQSRKGSPQLASVSCTDFAWTTAEGVKIGSSLPSYTGFGPAESCRSQGRKDAETVAEQERFDVSRHGSAMESSKLNQKDDACAALLSFLW